MIVNSRKEYVDMSFWQGNVDFFAMEEPFEGFILKTSEGVYKDKQFNNYVKGCQDNHKDWGVYHYYRSWVTGLKQAQVTLEVLDGRVPTRPICLDLESNDGANFGLVANSCRSYCEYIREQTGTIPMIYTGAGFMWNFLLYRNQIKWMADYPLWLAHYPWERNTNFIKDFTTYRLKATRGAWIPSTPYPWKQWELWQWTGHGRVTGLRGDVDMNVTFGEYPIQVPDVIDEIGIYRVKALWGLRVREEPNTSSKIITTISNNTMIGIHDIQAGWGYSEVYKGWLSMQYLYEVA